MPDQKCLPVCPKEKIEDMIIARLDRLEGKIDKIDEFRFKVVGGALVVSFLVSLLFNVFKK